MHAKMRAWLGAATILLVWQSQPVAAFLSESTQNRNQLIATNACQNCLLTEVDLIGLDLSGANLNGTDLTDANLKGANLTQANFTNATLMSTNFNNAVLTGADLSETNMTGPGGANFNDADLREAVLSGALIGPSVPMVPTLRNLSIQT